jgi:N-acyl-D-amino-acid deacylase
MAPTAGVYVTHVRYKIGLLPALKEAIEIGRRSGVGVHISHLKAVGRQAVDEVWKLLDDASRDVAVTFDVYPYLSGSTMLNYLLPYEVWDHGPLMAMEKLRSPEIRLRFAAGLNQYRLKLDRIRIAWVASADNKQHQGKTLADYVVGCRCAPVDALCNLLIEERLAVLLVLNEGEDDAVNPILKHDAFMMGSDGIYFPDGHVHPRVFGSATRLIGPLVRDAKLFSLEDAIFKMTSLPARRFGLAQRGAVQEGFFADLVVFDPQTVGDRATYDAPQRTSVGIEQLLVNGVFVVRDGKPVSFDRENAPGRWLTRDGE